MSTRSATPRHPRSNRSSSPDSRPPRQRAPLASGRLAALLALVLAVLLAVIACLPGGAAGPTPTPGPGSPTPGPTGSPAGSPEVSPSPTFVRPTPTPEPTFTSYVVRSGDTLSSIGRQFSTTARSIAFWNRESYPSLDPLSEAYEPNRIDVGWMLRILPGVIVDEGSLPTPTPAPPTSTPRPTTRPTSGPTATPAPPTGPSAVISNGPRGTNKVALTLDMGGRLDPAVAIMDWLIANNVRVTIFPTGKSGTTTAIGRQVLDRIKAHPELFEVANHSWDHPNFTELSEAQMADQLRRTEEAIAGYVGRTTKPWFRPPYGAWNATVRAGVGKAGWGYLVMWDIDTIDWRPTSDGGPTAKDIEAKVLSRAQGGSIVLMHLGGWHTLEALPGIVKGLRDRGFEPVRLSEMIPG